jgi:hypothetical protein
VGAMDSHQHAVANTAIKEKGVLSGVRIEKSEVGAPGEFDHIQDDDVERRLIERFTQPFGAEACDQRRVGANGAADGE